MDKIELRRVVGLQIRRYREEQDLSLKQLAGMVGTSYTHLWKVENAKVGVGLDLLGRIAEALGVPLVDLVEAPGQDGPNVTLFPIRGPQFSLTLEYGGHDRG